MNNASRFLMFAAMFMLFLIATWTAIEITRSLSSTLDKTDDVIYGQDPNVVPSSKIMGAYSVKGTEVLQSIYHLNNIGYDIQVGSTLFQNQDFDIDLYDLSPIDVTRTYSITYVRNADGSLNKVIFSPS